MAIEYTEAWIEGAAEFNPVSVIDSQGPIFPVHHTEYRPDGTARVYFFIETEDITQGRTVQTWEIAPTDPIVDAESAARAQAEDTMQQYANRVYSIAPKLQEINLTIFFTGQKTSDGVPGLPDGRNRFFKMVNGPFIFGWQGKLKLKLPDHDEVTVMPGVFRYSINRQRRNFAFVTGTFYVVPEGNKTGIGGGAQAEKAAEVVSKSDVVGSVAKTAAAPAWEGVATPNTPSVSASDTSILDKVSKQLSAALASVKSVENSITTPLAKAQATIRGLVDNVEALINEPAKIFTSLYSSCASIVSSIQDIGSQIESQYTIIGGVLTGFESMATGTDTTDSARGHAATIETVTHACALANIGRLYTTYSFPTQYEALEAIARYREASDNLLESLEYDGTPDISGNVRDLTGSVIDYLISEAANLPNVSEIQVPDQIPVVATCYEQYGDVSDAHLSDIINRNNVRNANFPPRELKILKSL